MIWYITHNERAKRVVTRSDNYYALNNEKRAMNTRTNKINSDSSERKYVMVWYRALKFVTRLKYEYARIAVDLFCENVTLVHCSPVVCNYVSTRNLDSQCRRSCGLTRETRHKPIAWHTHLLDCMICSILDGDLFTRWSLIAVNVKCSMGE